MDKYVDVTGFEVDMNWCANLVCSDSEAGAHACMNISTACGLTCDCACMTSPSHTQNDADRDGDLELHYSPHITHEFAASRQM